MDSADELLADMGLGSPRSSRPPSSSSTSARPFSSSTSAHPSTYTQPAAVQTPAVPPLSTLPAESTPVDLYADFEVSPGTSPQLTPKSNAVSNTPETWYKWLGLDPTNPADAPLLYVVDVGVDADLPFPWKAQSDGTFVSSLSGEIRNEHPLVPILRQKIATMRASGPAPTPSTSHAPAAQATTHTSPHDDTAISPPGLAPSSSESSFPELSDDEGALQPRPVSTYVSSAAPPASTYAAPPASGFAQTAINEHLGSIADLQRALAKEQTANASLQRELSYLKSAHQSQVQALSSEHEASMASLRARHAQEVEHATAMAKQSIEHAEATHASEMASAQRQFHSQMDALRKVHESELEALRRHEVNAAELAQIASKVSASSASIESLSQHMSVDSSMALDAIKAESARLERVRKELEDERSRVRELYARMDGIQSHSPSSARRLLDGDEEDSGPRIQSLAAWEASLKTKETSLKTEEVQTREELARERTQIIRDREALLADRELWVSQMSDEKRALAREQAELAASQAAANEAVNAASARVQDLEAQLEREYDSLATDRSTLRSAQAELEAKEAELDSLLARAKAERAEIADLKAALGAREARLDEASAALAEQTRALGDERATLSRRSSKLDADASEAARLKASLHDKEMILAEQQKRNETERLALARERETLTNDKIALSRQTSLAQARIQASSSSPIPASVPVATPAAAPAFQSTIRTYPATTATPAARPHPAPMAHQPFGGEAYSFLAKEISKWDKESLQAATELEAQRKYVLSLKQKSSTLIQPRPAVPLRTRNAPPAPPQHHLHFPNATSTPGGPFRSSSHQDQSSFIPLVQLSSMSTLAESDIGTPFMSRHPDPLPSERDDLSSDHDHHTSDE